MPTLYTTPTPTLTVGELITALSLYPKQMPIAVECEGEYLALLSKDFRIQARSLNFGATKAPTLIFEVTDY